MLCMHTKYKLNFDLKIVKESSAIHQQIIKKILTKTSYMVCVGRLTRTKNGHKSNSAHRLQSI